MTGNVSPFEILLVEDREPDIELTRMALAECGVPTTLHVVRAGTHAIRFLRREAEFTAAPRPHLVLLDLNLPQMPGYEVLAEIKRDIGIRAIPVVILSTSSDENDVRRAYENHANAYAVKPLAFNDLVKTLRMVTEYWLSAATLATHPSEALPPQRKV